MHSAAHSATPPSFSPHPLLRLLLRSSPTPLPHFLPALYPYFVMDNGGEESFAGRRSRCWGTPSQDGRLAGSSASPVHPDEAAAMGSTRGWCQGLGIVAGVFFSLPDLAEREAATAVGGLRGDDPGAAAPDGPGAATILVGATGWRCAHGGGRVLPARLLRRGMPRGYLPSSRSSSTACSPAPRRRASRPPALLEDLHATLTCRAPPRSWPGFFYKLLVDPHEVPSGEASCFLLSPEAVRRR